MRAIALTLTLTSFACVGGGDGDPPDGGRDLDVIALPADGGPRDGEGGPDVRDGGPDVRDGGPDVRDGGPDVRDGGPDVRDRGPDVRDGGPDPGERCDGLDDDGDGRIDEETDLRADPRNCGRCGRTCADGVECVTGFCGPRERAAAFSIIENYFGP